MPHFASHIVVPSNVVDAANKARYNALMGPCCLDSYETESALAAALEAWGFYVEHNADGRNRFISPWMAPEEMR
jgi:hypothetical protein